MTVLEPSASVPSASHSAERTAVFHRGIRNGIVIAAGYFVVSFTLGIAMAQAHLSPVEGLFCSLLNNASAGEYAGITMIASNASYLEAAVMTLTANIRYFLMSCSLSQKISPDTAFHHRLLIGFDVTDELFGLAVSEKGFLDPYYYYGAMAAAMPAWAGGTVLGILAGNAMPESLVSAFSIALYIMFLAVIIPEGKRNRTVGILICISFACSYLFSILPHLSALPEGVRTIILTVVLSALAAYARPVKEVNDHA